MYHLNVSYVSHSTGRSAVQAVAYITGSRLSETRRDLVADYRPRGKDVVWFETWAPAHASNHFRSLQAWDTLENFEDIYAKDHYKTEETQENYINHAQTAQTVVVALPRSLSVQACQALLLEFGQECFGARNLMFTVAIHQEEGNPHGHFMVSRRAILEQDQISPCKDRAITRKSSLVYIRRRWAEMANEALERGGHPERIDHRSLADQGLAFEATQHEGYYAQKRVRAGEYSRIHAENDAILERNREKAIENPLLILQELTSKQATFRVRDLTKCIQKRVGDDEVLAAKVYAHLMEHIIPIGQDMEGAVHYTSADYQQQEHALFQHVETLMQTPHTALCINPIARDTYLKTHYTDLNDEQKRAVEGLTDAHQLSVMIGRAGTGKTTYVLKPVVDLHQQAGFQVIGMALSATAAANLGVEAHCDAETIAFYLHKWQRLEVATERFWSLHPSHVHARIEADYRTLSQYALSAKHLVIVDEAGMVGTPTWQALVTRVQAAGAKLIAVGDDHQFKAIEAGDAFRKLVEQAQTHQRLSTLSTIYRQKAEWMREASQDLAELRIFKALAAYEQHGCVKALGPEGFDEIAKAYVEKRLREPHKTGLLLAHTRAHCQALNEAVRKAFKWQRQLQGFEYTLKGRSFAVGDEIVFLKNDRAQAIHTFDPQTGQAKDYQVKNGTRGELLAIDTVIVGPAPGDAAIAEMRLAALGVTAVFTVKLDEQTHAQFKTEDYGGLDHAYAVTLAEYDQIEHAYALTAHKSQGQTVDWAMVLASKSMGAYALYVMLTRHREAVTLYYDPKEFENFRALQQVFARLSFKTLAQDFTIAPAHRAAWERVQSYLVLGQDLIATQHEQDWVAWKAIKKARDLLGKSLLADWGPHARYLAQAGLTQESVAIACGRLARPLSQAETEAFERVEVYAEMVEHTRTLWGRIQSTHRGWRAYQHEDYVAYQQLRQRRNQQAKRIAAHKPLHREFVHKVFKGCLGWQAIQAQARAATPKLLSTDLVAAQQVVQQYATVAHQTRQRWYTWMAEMPKTQALTDHARDAALQTLMQTRQTLARQLLADPARYAGLIEAAKDQGVSTILMALHAGPSDSAQVALSAPDLEAPQRVADYLAKATLARQLWQGIYDTYSFGEYHLHPDYARFTQLKAERNALAVKLGQAPEAHHSWLKEAPEAAIAWERVARHAAQETEQPAPLLGAVSRPIRVDATWVSEELKLVQALDRQIHRLSTDLLGSPTMKTATDWHYGDSPDVSVCIAGRDKGRIVDTLRGTQGHGMALIAGIKGLDHAEALAWGKAWLAQQERGREGDGRGTQLAKPVARRTFVDHQVILGELKQSMEALARECIGQPNASLSHGHRLRFGSKGSIVVDLDRGVYTDFENNRGGGPLALIQEHTGLSGKDAFKWGMDFLGYERLEGTGQASDRGRRVPDKPVATQVTAKGSEWKPVFPVPAEVDAPDLVNNRFLRRVLTDHGLHEVARYAYRDAEGQLLGYAVRLEDEAGHKSLRPLTYCQNEQGQAYWRWKGFGDQRTLYGLEQLAKSPEKPVLVVEGEKAADAARVLPMCQDYVVVSWHGGVNAEKKVDWTPLVGREVVLWPDHDAAGVQAMDRIANRLFGLNQAQGAEASVRCVDLPRELPAKWDLADALPEGWGMARVLALLRGESGHAEKATASEQEQVHTTAVPQVEAWTHPDSSFVQETLREYGLKKPVLQVEIFTEKVQTRYHLLLEMEKLQGIESTPDELTAFKERSVLTEVLWFKAETAYCIGASRLETELHAGRIASEAAGLLQTYPDQQGPLKELMEEAYENQAAQLAEKDTLIQRYQQRYPEASERQCQLLAKQQLLYLNLTGEDLNRKAEQAILGHAKAFEALMESGAVKALSHELTPQLHRETEKSVAAMIEHKFMVLAGTLDAVGAGKRFTASRAQPCLQQAVHETQALHQQLEQQKILEREMRIQARAIVRDGGMER